MSQELSFYNYKSFDIINDPFSNSQLADTEASVTTSSSGAEDGNSDTIDTFDIVVHRVVDHSEIPQKTTFGCELTIPGFPKYKTEKKSYYSHRGGRKYLTYINYYNGNQFQDNMS